MKLQTYLMTGLLCVFAAACSDNNDEPESTLSVKEKALQSATSDYVNHTVLPTYAAMADAAIEMCDLCHT
ncbi:MAG: hypothetical protein K2M14_06005, partial [Muribaculaceae bacterium]|nr:hypothetical protein [Muribaculaceae bacterium]